MVNEEELIGEEVVIKEENIVEKEGIIEDIDITNKDEVKELGVRVLSLMIPYSTQRYIIVGTCFNLLNFPPGVVKSKKVILS